MTMEKIESGKMSIARALKEKERVARRLTEARKLFRECNSRPPDMIAKADAVETYEKLKALQARYLEVKKAIAAANAGICRELTEMLVVRAEIEFYNGLCCKEEDFKDEWQYVDGRATAQRRVRVVFNTLIKEEERRRIVEELEDRLDDLQDKVDAFNATHTVELPA